MKISFIFLIIVTVFNLSFANDLSVMKNELSNLETRIRNSYSHDQKLMEEYKQARAIYEQKKVDHENGLINVSELNYHVNILNTKAAEIERFRVSVDQLKNRRDKLKADIASVHSTRRQLENHMQVSQLTQAVTNSNREPINERTMGKTLSIHPMACEKYEADRSRNFPKPDAPNRVAELNRLKKLSRYCSVRIMETPRKDVVGFTLSNDMKNKINPRGNGMSGTAVRNWDFNFENRSMQNMNIQILDNSALAGRISHDFLHTTLVFIPRVNLPYIELNTDEQSIERKVILSTGEQVIFNTETNEIMSGVLSESPMGQNRSRHARKFAGINYSGKGIMIRADRRAGTPEHIYKVAFNKNEDIKRVIITHKGKTCRVSKTKIWKNATNPDLHPVFKYKTDQEFLNQVINPICKWNLTMDDIL